MEQTSRLAKKCPVYDWVGGFPPLTTITTPDAKSYLLRQIGTKVTLLYPPTASNLQFSQCRYTTFAPLSTPVSWLRGAGGARRTAGKIDHLTPQNMMRLEHGRSRVLLQVPRNQYDVPPWRSSCEAWKVAMSSRIHVELTHNIGKCLSGFLDVLPTP